MKPACAIVAALAVALVLPAVGPARANQFTGHLPTTTLKKQLPAPKPLPRQHLQCVDYPATQLPTVLVATTIPGAIAITNNTSQTIAGNTLYTYVVSGKTGAYLDHDSLAPGGHLAIPPPAGFGVSVQTTCDASVPG